MAPRSSQRHVARGAHPELGLDGYELPGRSPQLPPPRLRALPTRAIAGTAYPVATTLRARTLGLALIDRERVGSGLLIPRCRCIHTFGMRFVLDIVFLDASGAPISRRKGVRPRRVALERRAAAVLELPASAVRR